MTAPLIAIPTYHLGAGQVGTWDGAYALPESYVTALLQAGARTVLLPPPQPVAADELLAHFDGLLLAGGGDIEPARYGARDHPTQYGMDPDRDELELALARAAVELGVPTLGICRGVQLLNVAFGGTLLQHLPDLDGRIQHRNEGKQAMHDVEVAPGSRLTAALGQATARCLSHHHQGLDRIGDGFAPVAWAPDGLVEGIERDQGWTVGVLWHPESTTPRDPVQRRLLGGFVAAAARRGQAVWRPTAEPVGFGGPGSARG